MHGPTHLWRNAMRFVAIAALLAVCTGLSAQAYTVTSGALPSPYAGVANPTPAGLAHNQYTLPISPPGFQFPFFGGSFSSFQIASAGFISLSGAMQSVPSTPAPDQ